MKPQINNIYFTLLSLLQTIDHGLQVYHLVNYFKYERNFNDFLVTLY